jgi:hypothetical protein
MKSVVKSSGIGATVVPNVLATIPIFTRKGFHAYFAKRLSGFVCDDQAFTDWRGLRLPVCLKTGAAAVRRAFPVAQI